jgi:hypothetical protein
VRLRVQSSMEEFTGSARKAKSPLGYGRIWMGTEVTVWEPVAAGSRSGRTRHKRNV